MVIKRMALVFDQIDFNNLIKIKEKYRDKRGLTKLSWEDFIFLCINNLGGEKK